MTRSTYDRVCFWLAVVMVGLSVSVIAAGDVSMADALRFFLAVPERLLR